MKGITHLLHTLTSSVHWHGMTVLKLGMDTQTIKCIIEFKLMNNCTEYIHSISGVMQCNVMLCHAKLCNHDMSCRVK